MSDEDKKRVRAQAQLDQGSALVAGKLPPMVAEYYRSVKATGTFSESQAFTLTLQYHQSILANIFAPKPKEQA